MCVTEGDAEDRPKPNAATRLPDAFDDFSMDVPSLDELLADPEVSRRIGKIISDAARQVSRQKN